jgi:nitroimidazol reductase NimA-like FMN-containing flavoprotein (pyridoxamine 5'-phosphate oxidase superfamily)
VHAVFDEALICHVGFVRDGAPVVLPMVYGRSGDTLYLHASSGGRFALLDGERLGITVTLVDALVLGRSWFHHSAAYRSVVVHGTARVVADGQERLTAMRVLVDQVAAGRAATSRPPSKRELAQTVIVAVELSELSLKARGADVVDEPEDLDLPYWAGSIPLHLAAGAPVPAVDLAAGIDVPEYAADYRRGADSDG